VTYEAYVVSRTSTRPEVDSALPVDRGDATAVVLAEHGQHWADPGGFVDDDPLSDLSWQNHFLEKPAAAAGEQRNRTGRPAFLPRRIHDSVDVTAYGHPGVMAMAMVPGHRPDDVQLTNHLAAQADNAALRLIGHWGVQGNNRQAPSIKPQDPVDGISRDHAVDASWLSVRRRTCMN
jgi:hypothetical protein